MCFSAFSLIHRVESNNQAEHEIARQKQYQQDA